MVNGVVVGVIGHKLQWVERQGIAAVVVNAFECRKDEKEHCLPRGKPCQLFCDSGTEGFEQNPFHGMVVRRTKGIWYV